MFTHIDPLGYSVTCDQDQWNNHIITGHTIMNNNIVAVEDAIKNPDVIYKSSQSPIRNVYFGKSASSTYSNLYTKVVVEVDEQNKTAEVVSAWPQPTIAGGIDHGGVLYVKSKLW